VLGALQRLASSVYRAYPYPYDEETPNFPYAIIGSAGSTGCNLEDCRNYKKSLGNYLLKKLIEFNDKENV